MEISIVKQLLFKWQILEKSKLNIRAFCDDATFKTLCLLQILSKLFAAYYLYFQHVFEWIVEVRKRKAERWIILNFLQHLRNLTNARTLLKYRDVLSFQISFLFVFFSCVRFYDSFLLSLSPVSPRLVRVSWTTGRKSMIYDVCDVGEVFCSSRHIVK